MKHLNVIKIGGHVIDDQEKLSDFLLAFSQLEGLKVLVHGGGKIATEVATSMGVKTQMNNGRRITDEEMIKVVIMTYGGLVNKKLVSRLQGLGVQSIGLTGADGDLIRSTKRPVTNGIDYGFVGDIQEIDGSLIFWLLEKGMVPVIAPVTHDGKGNLLNTNADTIASELAGLLALHFNVDLNYCFELRGVMTNVDDPNSLIKKLNKEDYKGYKKQGVIKEGMIPKLDNAFGAIAKGVKSVRILSYGDLTNIQNKDYNDFTLVR